MTKSEITTSALMNAVNQNSVANYQAIFEGFAAKGIDQADIEPRVNVFTFNAWRALGRTVKKGEHGVKISTVIPCTKKDITGEEVAVKKVKTTSVFHISQTEEIGNDPTETNAEVEASTPAKVESETTEAQSENMKERAERYEQRQEEKRERYEQRAAKAAANSNELMNRSSQMATGIPFGQPILVGHHSESRDRAFRNRIGATMDKSITEQKRADYYEAKAESVGRGGISSDDPAAIEKLSEQLARAERVQEAMKKTNAVIRQRQGDEGAQIEGILAIGCYTNEQAENLTKPDYAGRIGFAAYQLANNNANISRIKKRIEELKKSESRESVEVKNETFTYREDALENRVMFIFEGKPDEETRATLKRQGFKWSPSRAAWVRQLNNAGTYAAQAVMHKLNAAT